MKTALPLLLLICGTLIDPRVFADEPASVVDPQDRLIVQTVLRMKSFDLESSAKAKAAVLRYLRSRPGTDQYFELIERFQPVEISDELAAYCLLHAQETAGVRGAQLLFEMDRGQVLADAVSHEDVQTATAAVDLIGHAGGKKTTELVLPLLTQKKTPLAVRTAAVSALGRSKDGQQAILKLVTAGKLTKDLQFAAANVLLSSTDATIKATAEQHLQLPATADTQPLPPVSELVKRRGDVAAGALVFRKLNLCATCHKVNGEGKELGPDLSEIGSKLSREAMYVSILDPSAAISHNYESYAAETDEGVVVVGLLVSDTDDSLTLKTQDGIIKKLDKATIEEYQKLKISMMPQDLQKLLTVQELVDLTEYLLTLRKPALVQ